MKNTEFSKVRNYLNKSQSQMASLLSVSTKAVQSFEQGWRQTPAYVERQLLLLLALKRRTSPENLKSCWEVMNCPDEWKENCIVWEYKAAYFCWLVSGTFCQGQVHKDWLEKIKFCRNCEVFQSVMPSQFSNP